jgi:chitin disaccharide deacetylase
MRRLVVTADDFGLCEAVNEAVERAHRDGILTAASLMVGGAAAADAVARARRMPSLRVGLHLVVVEGPSVLRHTELTDGEGWFPSDQLGLGVRYFFRPRLRRLLADEIRAQFEAFAATGLRLGHADAHKHMHLHPTVGRMMLEIGRAFGLDTVRVPREPVGTMARCGVAPTLGARAMAAWSGLFRRQARRAGMAVADNVFGLAWSGAVTEARVLALLAQLPEGTAELYTHPAARRDALLARWMPDYRHTEELVALTSPRVRSALEAAGVVLDRGG